MRLMKNLDSSIRAGQGIQRTAYFQETKNWMLEHVSAFWWIEQRNRRVGAVAVLRNRQALEAYAALLGPRKEKRRVA